METYIGFAEELFSRYGKKIERSLVEKVYRSMEGSLKSAFGSAFVKKYALLSASSVQVAMKSLMDKDILTRADDTSVRIYDYFFSDWLRSR